jgi:hypothetical protein
LNERYLATGLFALPFAYLAGLILSQYPLADTGLYFGFAACAAIAGLLGLGGARSQLIAVLVDVALAIVVAAALIAFSIFGGLASQLTVGVLVALPFLAAALTWRDRAGVAHRALSLAVSIVIGTALLAARAEVEGNGTARSPGAFVQAFFTVNVNQVQGLDAIATGGPEPFLPLRAAFDPTFAALCALAAAGLLLLTLRPQSGSQEPLPVAVSLEPPAARADPATMVPFSPAQRKAFAERSVSVPPTGAWPPGLEAVAVATLATAVFLAVAFARPVDAPIALVAATSVGLLGVGVTTHHPRGEASLRPL